MKKAIAAVLTAGLMLTAAGCGSSSGTSGASTSGSGGATGEGAKPAASSASSDKQVKLRIAWWGGQSRHDYTLKLVELYQKQHPNVKIDAEYAAFDDYWKKLAPQAASKDLPDIIQMDYAYLAQYGGKGQLEDMTPFTKNGSLDISSVAPSIIDSGKLDGKLYALSLGSNALGTFYDPELLKKGGVDALPKDFTWDDLEQINGKMKAQGKVMDHMRWDVLFNYYLRTQGQHLYNADGTALGFTDPKYYVEHFGRVQKWYDAGYMRSWDKEAQSKGTPEENPLATGEGYLSMAWSNQFIAYQQAAKKPLQIAPYPGPNTKSGLFMKPSMFFSIASNSKNKEEAAKFINWFTNDVEANKIIRGERGVPISSKIQEALKPILSPEEKQVFDYVAWASNNSSQIDPPDPAGSAEVSKLLKDLQEQILYKKITVQDAAAKFMKQANEILAKNKK